MILILYCVHFSAQFLKCLPLQIVQKIPKVAQVEFILIILIIN